jgi:hypothetical protein
MIVKRVGVMSAGKVMGVLYAGLGLIGGAFFSLVSLLGASIPSDPGRPNPGAGLLVFGAAAIIVFPIIYGILGFIGGIISGAIYNLAASVVGGIELDVN